MHVFEATIGPGPYHFVGIHTVSKKVKCAHCSTPIQNVYEIKVGDGTIFGVGSDCIHKVGLPESVLSQARFAKKEYDNKLRRSLNANKLKEAQDEVATIIKAFGPNLASLPHPTFNNSNLRNYCDYLSTCNSLSFIKSGLILLRNAIQDLPTAHTTDGFVVAYGPTFGMNDKFNGIGFSLKKVEGTWLWYRETLSDKTLAFEKVISTFGPNIQVVFLKDLSLIAEAKKIDRELAKEEAAVNVPPHALDGSIFEVSRWLSLRIKEDKGTAYAFRNLKVLKVKRETAKAYLIDAEFFSGIASSCGICGADLNNDISRATGIGPICAGKLGLPRPTMKTAKIIVEGLEKVSKAQGVLCDVWVAKSQIRHISEEMAQGERVALPIQGS